MIRATYDREADAIYITLEPEGEAAETVEIDEFRTVDVDDNGRVVGVEVLGVENYELGDVAERFGFKDRLPEINYHVGAALRRGVVFIETIVPNPVAGERPADTERTEKSVALPPEPEGELVAR
jgi:uncharacterized protein YuzE